VRNFILLPVLSALFFFGDLNITMASNILDVFLSSDNINVERKAYLEVLKNKKSYSVQIQHKLEAFQKTKDPRINVLNKLLYLAAIIKSEKFVEPLVKMLEDKQYLTNECIYDCPIVFTLTVFAISKNWFPPASMANSQNTKVSDLLSLTRWIGNLPLRRGYAGDDIQGPGMDDLLKRAHTLTETELIKQAGPENTDYDSRYAAACELAYTVIKDTNLWDLYWLAIKEVTDASMEYRNCVYLAILRAEKAKAMRQ
jgi:hypothetical protein